jgi:hypothetical protein
MSDRSYLGIVATENNEWIVVNQVQGELRWSAIFANTSEGLESPVKFISDRCPRPKPCVKSKNSQGLHLIPRIGSVTDIGVLLMSGAGLRVHRNWVPNLPARTSAPRAEILARRAECLI